MTYDWSFDFLWMYRIVLLKGLGITVAYTIGTALAGLMIGLLVALGRVRGSAVVNLPLRAYVELFRCTPLLVQLVWFYYALPVLVGIDIPASVAAALTLTLYAGAFYAEIFRGGINSIERGQWDAARAVGMRRRQVMSRIILPQAVRRIIPPIISLTVIQLKNTSLISTIAVADLLYQGAIITAATYRPLEVYTMIALLYFIVLLPMTLAAESFEQRLARND